MNIAMVVMSEQAAVSASGSVFRDANDAADRRGLPFPRRAPCRNTHGPELSAGWPGGLNRQEFLAGSPILSVCCLSTDGDADLASRPRPFSPASRASQPVLGETDDSIAAHLLPCVRVRGGRVLPSAALPDLLHPLEAGQGHRGGVSNRHERSGVVHAKKETPAWTVTPSFLQRQIIIRSTE